MNQPHLFDITRRNFLALSVTTLGAMGVTACAEEHNRSKPTFNGFIDAHSHVWTPDTKRFPLGPWMKPEEMQPASFTAEELLAIAKPSGVDRVVIIQHAPYYGDDNAYLLDLSLIHI